MPLVQMMYSTCVPLPVRTVSGKERPLVRIRLSLPDRFLPQGHDIQLTCFAADFDPGICILASRTPFFTVAD